MEVRARTIGKSAYQSLSVDNTVMFTTFIPYSDRDQSCALTVGVARAYSIYISTGLKRFGTLYESFATDSLPSSSIVSKQTIVRTDGSQPEDVSLKSSNLGLCFSGLKRLKIALNTAGESKLFGDKTRLPNDIRHDLGGISDGRRIALLPFQLSSFSDSLCT